MTSTHAQRLRDVGLRVTGPRLAVLAVLDEATVRAEHLLVHDVRTRACALTGDLSTQTVYDCLDALRRTGVARRVGTAGSPARYESRVGDHHDHLVCRACETIVDVHSTIDEVLFPDPAHHHGFVVEEAEVTYWGLCASCAGDFDTVAGRARDVNDCSRAYEATTQGEEPTT